MQNPLTYVLNRMNQYQEARRQEELEEIMNYAREQARDILSKNQWIREAHQSPEAWRLTC
jgi:hypothetical protein